MSFLEDVEKYFGVKCLYSALDLSKDAKEKQIKRAYHKFSLLCHPDRSEEDKKELNTVKFQTLSRIHSILSNKEKRAIYDETGDIPDEQDIKSQNKDWEAYWRILFKKVTKSDIEKFESEYKHSPKENEDLKKCYIEFEGDMKEILDNMLCSTAGDEGRFTETINEWLSNGEVPEFDAFTNESQVKKKKRMKKAKKEEAEAEELANELGLNKDSSLESMILARRVDREKESDSFFANLEAKYCQKEKKTNGKRKRK